MASISIFTYISYHYSVNEIVTLKSAILATLVYFDILNFPLTLEEIEFYLYGWSAPKEAIENEISRIDGIECAGGFYCLRGRGEIIKERKTRQSQSAKLWKRALRFRFLLQICPFVRTLAVCNSLAYGNATSESDIDLFVVTKNGR